MIENIDKNCKLIGPFFSLNNKHFEGKEGKIKNVILNMGVEMYEVEIENKKIYCYKDQIKIL